MFQPSKLLLENAKKAATRYNADHTAVAKVETGMLENLLFNSIFSCVYNYDVSHYNYIRWVHVTIVCFYEARVTMSTDHVTVSSILWYAT